MKTKQAVINFLNSKLGTKVPCVGNSSLDGQCVTLIKSLMEFLGVPNPYKARGNANTCISAYLNEGIANPGTGFLSVFSNKNMAGGVGHIWCNAGDGAGEFYESNGQKPLIVTKGKTYTYDNSCNFDKYIDLSGSESTDMNMYKGYDLSNADSMKVAVDKLVLVMSGELVDKFKLDDALARLATAKEDLLNTEVALAKCNAVKPPEIGWEVNGKIVETIDGNTKTIINYKKV